MLQCSNVQCSNAPSHIISCKTKQDKNIFTYKEIFLLYSHENFDSFIPILLSIDKCSNFQLFQINNITFHLT